MAATLDGVVEASGAVFEAKFMLPWSFSEESAAEKHMAQLQHNMWVVQSKAPFCRLSRAAASGSRSPSTPMSLYQHLLLTAEKNFWRCVQTGERPSLFGVEPPRPRIEAVRVVDMSASNSWAEFAGIYCRTRAAFLEHESAKSGAEDAHAGGRQGSLRTWRPRQAVEVRRDQLRCSSTRRQPCSTLVQSIGAIAAALAKAQADSSIPRSR